MIEQAIARTIHPPLVYIKKTHRLPESFNSVPPNLIGAMGNKKLVLIFDQYAVILDLKAEKEQQRYQFIFYPEKVNRYRRPNFLSNLYTLYEGFVMYTTKYYVHRKENWYQYSETNGSNTYSSFINFPDVDFFGEEIFENWEASIFQFTSRQHKLYFNFDTTGYYSQADDAGVVVSKINFEVRQIEFTNILKNEYLILDLPKQINEDQRIYGIFLIDQTQILWLISIYTIITLYKYNILKQESNIMKRLMGFPDYYIASFQRRHKQLNTVVITLKNKEYTQIKDILYNYKYEIVVKEVECQKRNEVFPFSPDLNIIVHNQKQTSMDIVYEQLVSTNRIYVDLIVKSGLQIIFGNQIVKEVLKALN